MIYCWLLLHRHCAQQLQAQAELSKNYERGIISIRLNRIIASKNIKIEIWFSRSTPTRFRLKIKLLPVAVERLFKEDRLFAGRGSMNIGHPIIATRVKFRVILYNVNLQILKQPWLDQEVNYLIVILHFVTFAIHSISRTCFPGKIGFVNGFIY